MAASHTPDLLIVSGPVGVGKTTVGHELSEKLCKRNTAHSFVDLDALAQTFPRPSGDRFGTQLALLNLAAVWANCRVSGSQVLIVSRVVETPGDVRDIERAVSLRRSLTCQLRASEATLVARIRQREIGSGLQRHEQRAIDLARSLALTGPADFVVDTDVLALPDVADAILKHAGFLP